MGRDALTFALGAIGGLAVGVLLSRPPAGARVGRLGSELRDAARAAGTRARGAARRLQPARLRRLAAEEAELSALEDRVLDALLGDAVLSERGIDVGAISHGIVELSGSVGTEEEAERAVRLAGGLPGVETVVNRMEIEAEAERLGHTRRDTGAGAGRETRWTGRMVGMNRRRQGRETDPDRPDDSQIQEDEALREADIQQWQDEDISWEQPQMAARPEVQSDRRTDYDEDELDNQDPHGKHAARTLDEQPQELNASARVGEGLKSGEHLTLEQADVPEKPHGGMPTEGEDQDEREST